MKIPLLPVSAYMYTVAVSIDAFCGFTSVVMEFPVVNDEMELEG